MNISEIISIVLIVVTFVYLFVLIFVIKSRYKNFTDAVRKIEPDYVEKLGISRPDPNGGGWYAGTYLFRVPLPINYKTSNNKIEKLIKRHDNTIKLYWVSIVTILPLDILILNLIN